MPRAKRKEIEQLDDDTLDAIEGEIITDISPAGQERILRVYDRNKGDFLLSIPADARVTFGYFNPGQPVDARGYGRNDEERRTALRVYKTEKHQLAVFLGVDGFRDTSLSLTRLRQKVTIETNYEDDGLGATDYREAARKQLAPAPENDEIPF